MPALPCPPAATPSAAAHASFTRQFHGLAGSAATLLRCCQAAARYLPRPYAASARRFSLLSVHAMSASAGDVQRRVAAAAMKRAALVFMPLRHGAFDPIALMAPAPFTRWRGVLRR